MTIKRFISLLFALLALLTQALGSYHVGAQQVAPASAGSVVGWNGIARRTAIQVGGQTPVHAMASIAIVQAAVYDAVVAIEGGYQPYQVRLAQTPGASVDAAVATAAHHVLVHYFPAQQAQLDADYAATLATLPDGAAKTAGIAVGQASAAGLIARRQGDGMEADIGFTLPAPGPGVWQLPEGQKPMTPWAAKLRPFMLHSPNQFRPDAPLEMSRRAWAEDFNEVKLLGSVDSTVRTAEQTDIARFWSTNPIVQYNTAFEQIVIDRGLNAVQAARLFAMGNLVGADALIACFDAKYTYLFWRPQFAIPQGESDGNPATMGDPNWKPLLGAPPHPEYPSAHGCLTGSQAEVFAAFFGTKQIEVDLTSSAPNVIQRQRHFAHVDDLNHEVMNARVWGGIHFRTATVKGMEMGRKVAHWTLKRYFQAEN